MKLKFEHEFNYGIESVEKENDVYTLRLKDGFSILGKQELEYTEFKKLARDVTCNMIYISESVVYGLERKNQFKRCYPKAPQTFFHGVGYATDPYNEYVFFKKDGTTKKVKSGKQLRRYCIDQAFEWAKRSPYAEQVEDMERLTRVARSKVSTHYGQNITLVSRTKGGYKCYFPKGYGCLQDAKSFQDIKPYCVGSSFDNLIENIIKYPCVPYVVKNGQVLIKSDLSKSKQRKSLEYLAKNHRQQLKKIKQVFVCKMGLVIELQENVFTYGRLKETDKAESCFVCGFGAINDALSPKWLRHDKEVIDSELLNGELYRAFLGSQEKIVKRIGKWCGDVEKSELYYIELKDGYESIYLKKPSKKAFLETVDELCCYCAKQNIMEV